MRMRFGVSRRVGVAVAVSALALSLVASGAVAGTLITSKQIKDNTILSRDIHNGTITGADVHNGSLGVEELSGSAVQQIQDGAVANVVDRYSWPISWTQTSETKPSFHATTVFPAGTVVTWDYALLTGTFTNCLGGATFTVDFQDMGSAQIGEPLYWATAGGQTLIDEPAIATGPTYTVPVDATMHVYGTCWDGGQYISVPTFDVALGFGVTHGALRLPLS